MAIVHVPGRRPFSQNLLHIYKDGHLVKTAPLRFPYLNEVCQAGLGRIRVVRAPGALRAKWGLEVLCALPLPLTCIPRHWALEFSRKSQA